MTQERPELNYYIKDYCKRMSKGKMRTYDQQENLPWQLEWIWHVHRLHSLAYLNDYCDKQDKLKKSKNLFSSNNTNLQFIPSIDLRSAVIRQKDFNRSIPKNNEQLYSNLISSKMKSLKHLNLNFEICEWEHNMYNHEDYVDLNYKELSIRKNSLNSLETIIIGYIPKGNRDYSTTRISFYSLIDKLLPCLPKLKNLIINSIYLDESDYQYYQHKKSSIEGKKSVIPSNLKVIKIWTDMTQYKEEKKKLKKLLRNYFMNDSSSDTTTIKIFTINNKNVLKEKF
ncbi:unnamed protein product [Rotaria sordida]|uniref:Uncharacterized protein n=2 Tax=Rotaria sordida TaxID=392033 RepID=A0A815IM37_9BILA|nr:unnamed protein product [Rotaria sordida]CAF1611473.1 unnamed protein product [Rotaria sordida]